MHPNNILRYIMIGALIGAALSAGSAIYGGVKASQAAKEANAMIAKEKQDNQNWYDQRYNEDATQRADAQQLLRITSDNIRNRNRAAAGTAAVMGATNEAVAAEKQANATAMADAVGQIAANGERRKDAIEQQYMAAKGQLTQQQVGIEQQRAKNIQTAAAGVADAAGNLATGIDGYSDAAAEAAKKAAGFKA